LHSPITPLLAMLALLLGLAAILVTPKEEEPQIEVTFADVFIPFPGATPQEVEQLVTTPAEQVISELKDIDTLYSFSKPGGAMLIVAFRWGNPVSRRWWISITNCYPTGIGYPPIWESVSRLSNPEPSMMSPSWP